MTPNYILSINNGHATTEGAFDTLYRKEGFASAADALDHAKTLDWQDMDGTAEDLRYEISEEINTGPAELSGVWPIA